VNFRVLGIANSGVFNIIVFSKSFIVNPLYPIKLIESSIPGYL